jgi:membrane fusion protein (multidrug efflux system)
MRLAIVSFLVAGALVLPSHAQQTPTTVPVGVVKAERKLVTTSLDFVGRVEAINRVEIKARVTGFLEEVLFKEGDPVKEGAPLYRIEKGLFETAVQQAEGALERSKAAKELSAVQLQRAQELLDKNAGTAVARDQAKAADDQAAGQITSDEANLATAKINLGYTDITSPIAGKASKTNITKGNLVGPDTGTLTTIVSQDPMYVTFPVSQRDFLKARETGTKLDVGAFKAQLRFADGTIYEPTGRINFIDVKVDRATDTVLVRATFPNPDSTLVDGQFAQVRVDLSAGSVKEQVVVPQAALIADQEGVYVFVVEDGKAVVKRVKPTKEAGTDVVVEAGLSGGEEVIVQGLQAVRPGAPVRATPIREALKQGG